MSKLKPAGMYCAYLRKSRADQELEALGQGETLARHEKQLRALAERCGIRISQIYREIVSGDTLAARPQAQQLLQDVNDGLWDGVLVMDVDRLGRGDTMDQGLIMQSFCYAGVVVITPDKIYDPADDADSEFFEMKLFFARREYNATKKRLQRGRIASAMEGSYLSGPIPYGYDRYRIPGRRGGYTLKPNPETAEIVRAIFTWYAHGMDGKPAGTLAICQRLHEMGLKTNRGYEFTSSTLLTMLHNPVYAGKIRWNRRHTVTRIENGQKVKRRPLSDQPILVDGLHEAIISPDLFEAVQQRIAGRIIRPVATTHDMINPFAGLVYCDACGHALVRKPQAGNRGPCLCCRTQRCPTFSAYVDVVERAILDGLRGWLQEFDRDPVSPPPDVNPVASARAQLTAQREALGAQLTRQFDALEQGVYSMDEFRARRAEITARIADVDRALQNLDTLSDPPTSRRPLIPKIKTVLAAYETAETPAEKNALLRTVLARVDYHKRQRGYRNSPPGAHLTLTLYPRLPQSPSDT